MTNENKNKRYYWIKLKDTFFTSDTVDFLMSQKNGANYVVLYQMLCLKTVNTNGNLSRQIGEMIIPFDIEKIQRDCKYFDVDTIRVALELYKKLGLIYEQENGILQISNFDNLVGSETQGAVEKRQQRQQKKLEQNAGIDNGIDPVYQENRDKILDIRDKSIDNKDNTKENTIKEIFEYWNSNNIVVHRELTIDTRKSIEKALKIYSVEEIKTYIDRYNMVIKDKEYFFSTIWTLKDFLSRKNGVSDFTNEGSKWLNYLAEKNRKTTSRKPTTEYDVYDEF